MSAMTVGILGGGRWGFALARAAQTAGNRAIVCTRRDTSELPEGVELTPEVSTLGARCNLIILAVPSAVARPVATTLGDCTSGAHYVVHAVRGLSSEGLLPISTVVRQETPVKRVGALAGPVLAQDLLEGRPSVIAVASHYPEVIDSVKHAIASPALRVSTSDDIIGTEWASALVGALLVGVGFAREMGISEPLIAGLMVRALREASLMGVAAGGLEKTFYSLAGIGDLMAAMAQQGARPEVAFGQRIARGARAAELAAEMGVRIESIDLVPRVVTFARQRNIRAPVFETLATVIEGRGEVSEIMLALMRS